MSFNDRHCSAGALRPGRRAGVGRRVSYLPEAGVDGADEHTEGLARAAAHGAEHLAQEGDEAQPALHVLLLQLLPHREVLLRRHKRLCQPCRARRGAWAPPAFLWSMLSKGWSGATGKPVFSRGRGMSDLGLQQMMGLTVGSRTTLTFGHGIWSSVSPDWGSLSLASLTSILEWG